MGSLQRKLKRKVKKVRSGPGKGPKGTIKANIILKLNPETGKMQEYHLTKGWRK